jgi:selenocysteine lyase/cysteine desulfurase
LLFEHRIEVQLHARNGRLWTRVSAQIYNDEDDIEKLAAAVERRQAAVRIYNSGREGQEDRKDKQ